MDTNKNQPDIEDRIKKWKSDFTFTALTSGDTEELADHVRETYYDLLECGLTENEAWMIASHRIGEPEVIKEEFKKVNQGFTIDRNWMMLLWGAVMVLILQAVFILIPLLYKNSIVDFVMSSGDTVFISDKHYSMGVIGVALAVLFIIRDGRLIRRFTNSLARYASLYAIVAIIAGLWAAFFSYMLFANTTITPEAATGLKTDIRDSLSFLMFGFYLPLMAITGFSTMKYFSREMVSFKGFNKSITWKHAIILGLLAQAPVQFGNAFPGDSVVKAGVIITVSVMLFLIIGCMISYSKKPVFNLVCAQTPPMLLLITSTTLVSENVKILLFVIYFVKIIALAGGYFWSRQRFAQDFATN